MTYPNMTHKEWVRKQFKQFKKRYRDVLLITSFIETIIRDKASSNACKRREDFKKSLKSLGLKIDGNNEKKSSYSQNCQYKKGCLKEINEIRVQRNELLHDIIRESLRRNILRIQLKRWRKTLSRFVPSQT